MTVQSVSIVIPTHNRARLVVRAVRSVLAAVAPGDEIIVVDDGSTDDTQQMLKPYGDQIRYIYGPHHGVGAARNRGMAAANNPLVAFNDSDDEWFPDKLTLQRAFMQARSDVLFCFSDFGLRSGDSSDTHHGLRTWHQDLRGWDEILGPAINYSSIAALPAGRSDFNVHIGNLYLALLRANYVAVQSMIIRREQLMGAIFFAEDISVHEDYECFVRAARVGQAAYFDCETFWQWSHTGPRLTEAQESLRARSWIKVQERTFGVDKHFLLRHHSPYKEALRAKHLALTRCLIGEGHLDEARAALRAVVDAPITYQLLAWSPNSLVRHVMRIRRLVRATARN